MNEREKNIFEGGKLSERKRILAIVEDEQTAWLEDTKMFNICERIKYGINKPYT